MMVYQELLQFTIYICKSDTRRTPPTLCFSPKLLHVLGGASNLIKNLAFMYSSCLCYIKRDYLTSTITRSMRLFIPRGLMSPRDSCRATILSWILMLGILVDKYSSTLTASSLISISKGFSWNIFTKDVCRLSGLSLIHKLAI